MPAADPSASTAGICAVSSGPRPAPAGTDAPEEPEEPEEPPGEEAPEDAEEPELLGGLRGANQSLVPCENCSPLPEVPPPPWPLPRPEDAEAEGDEGAEDPDGDEAPADPGAPVEAEARRPSPTVPPPAGAPDPAVAAAPSLRDAGETDDARADRPAAALPAPEPESASAAPFLLFSLSSPLSSSDTGVRITTGGMGREPGMLIRIRVVSVVSVFGSSGFAPAAGSVPWSAWSTPAPEAPYGSVPEGYAEPPRLCGPEDELSVSRLNAGTPGWMRRLH
ncbi:hypothetical protein SCA03_47080 [Streptomyces cacaoi]|uniref:Uncharacterized protein n=1 Tax=Streptomyces cacaoi TaxID=1898 RepID=A0A4Y3R5P5_STRCI|nr:hypothetical protein SCA03_47080 [Streptomyces cacaoi]